MAIAQDAVSKNRTTSSTATLTWSHVCTGSDLTLIVFACWGDSAGSSPTVSALTYNAVSLTFGARAQQSFGGDNYSTVEAWYLDDPATGSNTVSITLSETADSAWLAGYAVSYTGSQGVGSTFGTATGFGDNPSTTFTTDESTSKIAAAVDGYQNGVTWTEGTGTSLLDSYTSGKASWSGEEDASGGSDTVDVTMSAFAHYGMVAIEVKEAAAGGDSIPYLSGLRKRRFQPQIVR
jgi:hypothetical protein